MKNTNNTHYSSLYTATLFVLFCSPSIALAQNVVTQWNDAALQAVRVTNPGPPITARALAITNTCMFDAWAAYDINALGTRLGSALRRPATEFTDANKQKAISFAAYTCLNDLFPSQAANFDNLMGTLGYNPKDNTTDLSQPVGIGKAAANAVLNFRHSDGSNQLGDLHPGAYTDYTGYQPVNSPNTVVDPNHWQPLQFSGKTQAFIAPFWGKVVPYALKSGSQFTRTVIPPADYYKEPARYKLQAQQILDYSANLSDEKKVIAEYWANGPSSEQPPGHWVLFSEFVSSRDKHTLDQDAKMFFAVTNAIFDAGIAAWDAKRFYDYVRPITAIHVVFAGQSVNTWQGVVDGASWEPYQPASSITPSFPEYISGHSCFSAAGAETLKQFTKNDYFGENIIISAGSSIVQPGQTPSKDTTLYWATFSDAADEAGISRLYGGIHFKDGDLQSRKIGQLVAQQAWNKTLSYFNDPNLGSYYDPSIYSLTLEDVLVNGVHYGAVLKNIGSGQFSLVDFYPLLKESVSNSVVNYDTNSGIVTIPYVISSGSAYSVTLKRMSDTIFSVVTITPI